MALTPVIIRISPITQKPVVFFPETFAQGALDGYTEGKRVRLGLDYYNASAPLDVEQSRKIAQAYAKQAGIAEHDLIVKVRRPKTSPGKKARKTNDANLVLVDSNKSEKGQESNQDYRSKDELAAAAQAMQNEHNKKKSREKSVEDAVKPLEALAKEFKQEEKKTENTASAASPEGATVERARRKYEKRSNKRSEAAMKRYLSELGQVASESPTLLEPAKTNASKEQVDQATLDLAMALAKILKGHGVL
jgi:hypothetical protein